MPTDPNTSGNPQSGGDRPQDPSGQGNQDANRPPNLSDPPETFREPRPRPTGGNNQPPPNNSSSGNGGAPSDGGQPVNGDQPRQPGGPPNNRQKPPSARSIAASQSLITTTSRPTTEGDRERKRRTIPSYRRELQQEGYAPPRDRNFDRDFNQRRQEGYRRPPYDQPPGGGGYGPGRGGNGGRGGGNGANPNSVEPNKKRNRALAVIIGVAIIAFFSGFAMRDFYTAQGGFDDERPIQSEQVPENLREFCIDYNGLPSFTLINIASTSALSTTTVPVLKLDTCTIPSTQTANALQALGVDRRSVAVGLQLGGSNLTLVNLPLTNSLANQLFYRFPALADSLEGNTDARQINDLESILDGMLRSGADGVSLQNILKTNMPDVYAVTPGHVFQLQPDIQAPP